MTFGRESVHREWTRDWTQRRSNCIYCCCQAIKRCNSHTIGIYTHTLLRGFMPHCMTVEEWNSTSDVLIGVFGALSPATKLAKHS